MNLGSQLVLNAGLTMDLAGFLFSFEGMLILLSYSLKQGIADHSNKLKIEILFHFLGHRPILYMQETQAFYLIFLR